MVTLFDSAFVHKVAPVRRSFGRGVHAYAPADPPSYEPSPDDRAWWAYESTRMAELRNAALLGMLPPGFAETLANMGHRD